MSNYPSIHFLCLHIHTLGHRSLLEHIPAVYRWEVWSTLERPAYHSLRHKDRQPLTAIVILDSLFYLTSKSLDCGRKPHATCKRRIEKNILRAILLWGDRPNHRTTILMINLEWFSWSCDCYRYFILTLTNHLASNSLKDKRHFITGVVFAFVLFEVSMILTVYFCIFPLYFCGRPLIQHLWLHSSSEQKHIALLLIYSSIWHLKISKV